VAVEVGGVIEGGDEGRGGLTLGSVGFYGAATLQGHLGAATPIVVTGGLLLNGGDGSIAIELPELPANGTYHFLQHSGDNPFSALRLAVPTPGVTLVTIAPRASSTSPSTFIGVQCGPGR